MSEQSVPQPSLQSRVFDPKGVFRKNTKPLLYLGAAALVILAAIFSSYGKKTTASAASKNARRSRSFRTTPRTTSKTSKTRWTPRSRSKRRTRRLKRRLILRSPMQQPHRERLQQAMARMAKALAHPANLALILRAAAVSPQPCSRSDRCLRLKRVTKHSMDDSPRIWPLSSPQPKNRFSLRFQSRLLETRRRADRLRPPPIPSVPKHRLQSELPKSTSTLLPVSPT